MKLLLASSNAHKLAEYQDLAAAVSSGGVLVEIAALPGFDSFPPYEESAPTFAENAVGKALHYSRFAENAVMADDSGLCVEALGGAPGVHSARYAGADATSDQRIAKLLAELRAAGAMHPEQRRARFVCVLALVQQGRALAIVSDSAEGVILNEPRGTGGFGFDPVFFFPPLNRTFAELSREEKNQHSHRGNAFRRLCELCEVSVPPC